MMITSWGPTIERYLTYLRASNHRSRTVSLRYWHLSKLAGDLNPLTPAEVTFDDLVTWLGQPDWSPNTRRSYRTTLRSFFSWMVAVGLVPASPAALLPPVRVPRARPRPTPEDVLREALMVADDLERRAVLLAAHCGLRVGEIAAVRREDVLQRGEHWSLRVAGKGGHVRVVPLPDDLARDLLRLPAGWVFPSPVRAGRHLTPHHLGKRVTATMAGRFTTHTLRHRCGTAAYQATLDIRSVQELLGHAKLDTTQVYTEVADSAVRAAMLGAAPQPWTPGPTAA